tara:strand:- start:390 stop:584 length:195 start_codon:yes stop_codon:yes gene_type:complete
MPTASEVLAALRIIKPEIEAVINGKEDKNITLKDVKILRGEGRPKVTQSQLNHAVSEVRRNADI